MFSSSSQSNRGLAKLTLTDGTVMIVSVKLSMSGKLGDAFNSSETFLDVILGDGTAQWINKKSISRAEAADPPKAKLNQQRRNSDQAGFDPYAILGVANSATAEELRVAYVALVKKYHPDRFAAFDLPQEMKDYAAAMQARINMAYQQLGS